MMIMRLWVMLMLFTPGIANALSEAETNSIVNQMFEKSCSAENASFLRYMFALYGDIICFDDGYATLLTKVIGFVNIISMAFMIVLSTWFFMTGILRTAAEGEVLGKTWSTIWMPIRVSTGVALIMPSSAAAGYISTAQAFIFHLIMSGSMAANLLWGMAIDELVQPSGKSNAILDGQALEFEQRLQIVSCMEALVLKGSKPEIEYFYLEPNHSAPTASGEYGAVSSIGNAPLMIKKPKKITYAPSSFATIKNQKRLVEVKFGEECGVQSFSWNEEAANKIPGSDFLNAKQIVEQATKTAAKTLTDRILDQYVAIMPIAKAIVADTGEMVNVGTDTLPGLGNILEYQDRSRLYANNEDPEMAKYWLAYLKVLDKESSALVSDIVNIDNAPLLKQWADEAKKRGWIYAGMFFLDIPMIENMPNKIITSTVGNVTLPSMEDCQPVKSWIGIEYYPKSCAFQHEAYIKYQTASLFAKDALGKFYSLSPAEAGKYAVDISSSKGTGGEGTFEVEAIERVAQFFMPGDSGLSPYGTSGGVLDRESGKRLMSTVDNPITTTQRYGVFFEWAYSLVKIATIATAAKLDLINSAPFIETPFVGGLVIDGLKWIQQYLMIGAFLFGYYLPLMPVMTWVAAIFVIFKITVQAVVAFPLSIVQMMNPEGEGISGQRMERSWALLAAVFLRPSLTVIALFASISLSIVTFEFFQTIFWSSVSVNSIVGFIAVPGSYLIAITAIIKQSIWIINELPEVVLNWFSAGVGGGFGSNPQQLGDSGNIAGSHSVNAGSTSAALQKAKDEQEAANKQKQGTITQGS